LRRGKKTPTSGDERKFEATTFRQTVWNWRDVLPPERGEALEKIASEFGGPDAWSERVFPPEESPLTGADFLVRPTSEIVAFLRSWSPNGEQQCQTVTALAQELHSAVYHDPETYAANADQFSGLKPIYIRRVLEGLQIAASHESNYGWGNVLKLIEFTLAQFHKMVDASSITEGDDRAWTWAWMTASKLLAVGLRRGADGIEFEHAAFVR
jgi:hypothetical protein